MVEFVRAGKVLCVIPLNPLHFGSPKHAAIRGGSAWIAAHPLTSSAPADAFAGIAVQSGELTSTEALPFGGTTSTVQPAGPLHLAFPPWQLSLSPPDPTSPDPVLADATHLRT